MINWRQRDLVMPSFGLAEFILATSELTSYDIDLGQGLDRGYGS